MDQGCAGGDAGAAEVAGDFLVEVHRMEERSRAMQERDEGQSDGSLLIGLTTKFSGEALFQEFKRRHELSLREVEMPIFGDEAVVVWIGAQEISRITGDLSGGAGWVDC